MALIAESVAWHARRIEEVLAKLQTKREGLSSAEAARRLAAHGPNALPTVRGRNPAMRFFEQFNSALIYFLLAAALSAWVLGRAVDAAVILAVVVANALVGFIQEGKAEKALDAMRKVISPQANVLRDGVRKAVPVDSVVPGDVVLLEAGDRVPADLRLLRARGLLIDEALLTGESVPSAKEAAPVAPGADLGARHSMAFSGTLVAAGQANGLVVETGEATALGRISALLQGVEPLSTPLLRQMNRFGRRLTLLAILGAAVLFAFAIVVRDYAWPQALLGVVALAVGLVPEGLPAVISITLAIGVRRMAARNAIIRRLPAVETLGATSVICTDKTGTLTCNEMTARTIVTAEHEAMVSGTGYIPDGRVGALDRADDAVAIATAMPVLRCGVLCNDAQLHERGGAFGVDGDPMEGALIVLAMKAGLNADHVRAEWPRLDEIPFDAAYRFMATLNRGPDGEKYVFVKGAPEKLLELAPSADGSYWGARIAERASAGERVLGFAVKKATGDRLRFAELDGVEFLGIVGFIDPPRKEALRAIAECHGAGIAVKMITGDHVATAVAIARSLHISRDPQAVTGSELERLSPQEFDERVHAAAVFARASPEHKLRIVQALQARGAVVAMTGDGVNDAPALKQADVGVAMGIKGTEAAKEAAEMVLLDDNFASIVNAVHEGRTVYDNIRKVVSWTLPTNGGEVMTVIAALLLGFVLPMTTAQILWVNLVTSVTLGLVFSFEPPEAGVMRRPPRLARAPLLSRFLVWRVALVSLLFAAISLAIFFHALDRGYDVETARTLVVNTLVVLEIFYLLNVRYQNTISITLRGALGTPAVAYALAAIVLAQLAFTYLPVMQSWFATRPVAFADGVLVVACGVGLLFLLEGEKLLLRRLGLLDLRGETR